MSLTVDLGSFQLAHTEQASPVTVSLQATIKPACGDSPITLSNNGLLEHLVSGKVWIARSHTFVFKIQVCGVSCGQLDLDDTAKSVLSRVITQATLWQQLDLEIESIGAQSLDDKRCVLFRVSHHDPLSGSIPKRSHKLRMDDCITDLRPPIGIPTLFLERLDLRLETRGFEKHTDREIDANANDDHDDYMLLKTADEGYDTEEDHLMFDDLCDDSRRNTHRTTCTSGLMVPTSQSMLPWLAGVLDASLRYWICASPKRLHQGIRLLHDFRQITGQMFAPAIWTPGYLRAMAERACLIPTISRALGNTSTARPLSTVHVRTHVASVLPHLAAMSCTLWVKIHMELRTCMKKPLARLILWTDTTNMQQQGLEMVEDKDANRAELDSGYALVDNLCEDDLLRYSWSRAPKPTAEHANADIISLDSLADEDLLPLMPNDESHATNELHRPCSDQVLAPLLVNTISLQAPTLCNEDGDSDSEELLSTQSSLNSIEGDQVQCRDILFEGRPYNKTKGTQAKLATAVHDMYLDSDDDVLCTD